MRWYTGQNYADLNKRLREGLPLTDIQSEKVRLIDSAIENIDDYQGTVYRKVILPSNVVADEFINLHQPGGVVRYKQYISTAKTTDAFGYDSPGNSNTIRLQIASKTGKDTEPFSQYPEEQEVLFGRKARFVVQNATVREDGGYNIMLVEI